MSLRTFGVTLAAAFIVFADELAKFYAIRFLQEDTSLTSVGLINFAVHKNPGIAFDIPFKMPIIVLVSIIIGVGLVRIAIKNWNRHPDIALSAIVIIIGAIGNLYDRLVYGFTVDYIILFGRSAINLSDIVIVSGIIGLLLASRRTRIHQTIHPDEPQRHKTAITDI